MECESSRLAVVTARWTFLMHALTEDQLKISKIKAVPAQLAIKQHKKLVEHRKQQSEVGEKAVLGYTNKYVRVETLKKADQCLEKIVSCGQSIAPNLVDVYACLGLQSAHDNQA